MTFEIDAKQVKQRVKTAINSGAMWKNADGYITTSVFELAQSLQQCGVDFIMANSLPAVNAVYLLDGPQLGKLFGDEPFPEIKSRSDTARGFL